MEVAKRHTHTLLHRVWHKTQEWWEPEKIIYEVVFHHSKTQTCDLHQMRIVLPISVSVDLDTVHNYSSIYTLSIVSVLLFVLSSPANTHQSYTHVYAFIYRIYMKIRNKYLGQDKKIHVFWRFAHNLSIAIFCQLSLIDSIAVRIPIALVDTFPILNVCTHVCVFVCIGILCFQTKTNLGAGNFSNSSFITRCNNWYTGFNLSLISSSRHVRWRLCGLMAVDVWFT